MTSAQWRVLTILLMAGVMEVLFSPAVGTTLKNFQHGNFLAGPVDTSKPIVTQLAAPAISAIGFVIGAMLLLWLASGVPNLATALALAILALIILRYGSDVTAFLSDLTPQQGGKTST